MPVMKLGLLLKRFIMKSKIQIKVLLFAVILTAISCQKDEDNEPGIPANPTNGLTTAVFDPDIEYGTLTDQDGNIYKTVTFAGQTWMAENLRTTKYNDGSDINEAKNHNDLSSTILNSSVGGKGGFCTFNFTTDPVQIATYGRLYDFNAVNSGKLAPKGWHIALVSDYEILAQRLGGHLSGSAYNKAGSKIRETGYTHWKEPNFQADNNMGFTALPAGYYEPNLDFSGKGTHAMFWADTGVIVRLWTGDDYLELYGSIVLKELCSVRCVKNE